METPQVETRDESVDPAILVRYLNLLGVSQREPSLGALNELVSAHLTRVPFENISKLYYWRRLRLAGLPSFQRFLDGIERYHFGGTCYSNNFHFYALLKCLGYNVRLCGSDMSIPGVHMVSVVTIEGQEFLVDTGYAAPFLSPLPLDLATDHVICLGRDRYVLKSKDASGSSRLELHRDGKLKHGYIVRPGGRRLDDFQEVIADSFHRSATFLNSILLARFWPGRSLVLHNQTLVDSTPVQSTTQSLGGMRAVIDTIESCFQIPGEIATAALEGLGELEDAWGGPSPCAPQTVGP